MGGIFQCLMNVVFVSMAGEVQCHTDAACTRGTTGAYAEITCIFLPNAKEKQAAKDGGKQDPFGAAFTPQPFKNSVSKPKEIDEYQEQNPGLNRKQAARPIHNDRKRKWEEKYG